MLETREFLALHRLFGSILEELVGGELPLPAAVESLLRGGAASQRLPEEAGRWLALLDLCLTPPLFRTGIQKQSPDEETLASVIRYLVSKKPRGEADRDRLDWLLTYIFKRRAKSGATVTFTALRGSIVNWLGSVLDQPLSETAQNLLSEVAIAVEDTTELRSFAQLTESGLIPRVRDLKEKFQEEFFHPQVLPAIVNYNLLFGKRFEELFSEAARQAHELASAIADKDYRSTSEDFRKLSSAVKEVKPAPAAPEAPAEKLPASVEAPPEDLLERTKALGIDPLWHWTQFKIATGEIASFVKAAGRTVRTIPMPHTALPVTDWESAAFSVDYPATDRTFRAEFSRRMRSAVTCMARMQEEFNRYQDKRDTKYLWKPHYDAVLYMVHYGRQQIPELERFAEEALSRGLPDKADQISRTCGRLRDWVERLAKIF